MVFWEHRLKTHDLVIYSWLMCEELVSQEIKQSVAGIGAAQCQSWDLSSIPQTLVRQDSEESGLLTWGQVLSLSVTERSYKIVLLKLLKKFKPCRNYTLKCASSSHFLLFSYTPIANLVLQRKQW